MWIDLVWFYHCWTLWSLILQTEAFILGTILRSLDIQKASSRAGDKVHLAYLELVKRSSNYLGFHQPRVKHEASFYNRTSAESQRVNQEYWISLQPWNSDAKYWHVSKVVLLQKRQEMKTIRQWLSQTRTMVRHVNALKENQSTNIAGSPFSHHLTITTRCRSFTNHFTDIYSRRKIYAGEDNKVGASSNEKEMTS